MESGLPFDGPGVELTLETCWESLLPIGKSSSPKRICFGFPEAVDVKVECHDGMHCLQILRCGVGLHFVFLDLDIHHLNRLDEWKSKIQSFAKHLSGDGGESQVHAALPSRNRAEWRKEEKELHSRSLTLPTRPPAACAITR